ncbi:hypothetical protein [Niabella ginsengisoli]|uniref:Uncharacterized protein n=1 Tax=Niabella ginsengisoli TaxID=522298 RepID=A0ABS9SK27_9BACT|nr:hypothetical protein [Niabella ginsengisoli]MCH5598726.1 hypothetical protein [Niabella ginsengisoli]
MASLFDLYNYLGFHNPYYTEVGQQMISSEFEKIIEPVNSRTLDFTAVVQILSAGYAFGDRTLIQEVKKTPWMARPGVKKGDWEYFDLPNHQENLIEQEEAALRFYELLKKNLAAI